MKQMKGKYINERIKGQGINKRIIKLESEPEVKDWEYLGFSKG